MSIRESKKAWLAGVAKAGVVEMEGTERNQGESKNRAGRKRISNSEYYLRDLRRS